MLIFLIVSVLATNLGAAEKKITSNQTVLLEAMVYGQCHIMTLQLDNEKVVADFVVFWIEYAKSYKLNLEQLTLRCHQLSEASEERYQLLGSQPIVAETF